MEEDIGLIEKYLSGQESAFEDLVMKYQRQIFAFVYRMIGDREESKDLTQRAFIQALMGISGFRRQAAFRTWLYQIALNVCRNHLKRHRHEDAEVEDTLAGNGESALSAMIEREKKDQMRLALERLPERQRIAVLLRVYDGLSCEETARVMGCSTGAVKAHYHFGVKKLKDVLREKGYEIRS